MSLTRWVFGGLGFVLGGPIGALIGILLAKLFTYNENVLYEDATKSDDNNEQNRRVKSNSRPTVGDIRVSIVVLIACVIKADGKVLKSEINYIKPFLLRTFGHEGALSALQLLKELLNKDINHIEVANQISKHVNYSTRLEFVHLLLDLAYSDGNVATQEANVIRQIADAMFLQKKDIDSIFAMYVKEDINWAYKVLEIEADATNEEVKKAYRRMAMKYHPDKVNNAGQEIYEKANEKFREVNKAYEHIKDMRGMK